MQFFLDNLLANLDLVATVLVFYLVLYLGNHQLEQDIPSAQPTAGLETWLTVSCLLGGRLVAVVPEAPLYLDSPLDLVRLNTGLSFYGALAGGALALALFARRRSINLLKLADAFLLYLPLGIALHRLGCLVYGFCAGKPAAFPLGVPLPGHVGLRYPSELYEGLLALALFAALQLLSRRPVPAGTATGLFLLVYPLIRALVDLTRLPTGPLPWADSVASLAVAMVGAIICLLAWRRTRHSSPAGRRENNHHIPNVESAD